MREWKADVRRSNTDNNEIIMLSTRYTGSQWGKKQSNSKLNTSLAKLCFDQNLYVYAAYAPCVHACWIRRNGFSACGHKTDMRANPFSYIKSNPLCVGLAVCNLCKSVSDCLLPSGASLLSSCLAPLQPTEAFTLPVRKYQKSVTVPKASEGGAK